MKSIAVSSIVVALLVLGGCSSKEVVLDTEKTEAITLSTVQEVKAGETETVTAEESIVNSNTNSLSHMSMSDIESELSTVYFDFDKFSISSKAESKITKAAELGKTGASAYNLKLEGNCDEWGSDEYNFALGLKRASSVKKALVAEGIDASRISMVSYGESNPVCEDKTQDCYSKNRRVDFKLLP